MRRLLLTVDGHSLSVLVHEQLEHLAWFGMATGLGFGVDQFSVDRYVEHTLGACRQRQRSDDVLVAREDVFGRAHGTVEIVSGYAILDIDVMHGRITLATGVRPVALTTPWNRQHLPPETNNDQQQSGEDLHNSPGQPTDPFDVLIPSEQPIACEPDENTAYQNV